MLHQGNFTEKELMNDLLMSEKQISSAYTASITESSCPNLRRILASCEQNVFTNQENIFKVMTQRGWCNIKKAPSQDVQAAKDKFNQMKSELK
ncbi:spore coat protein CotF [Anaerosolibacter carboniphilus]|uniref:Spore coat protein CotF n=1 Tax=Anaerosolibacter carboniphilus TaxID=1417629 RepID=A0A841L1Z1_9FIRM|nr:spore coat protein [Anaerosolibacter carboniphilus]MBB6218638.1 spore coat protein CotF [Anaerosolibacter carboniphilus]